MLPFEQIDVLIVDEMGKNISGSGMDPNVLGRRAHLERVNRRQEVRAIYVRALTPETHGNAIGVGMADVVSDRLVNEMDKVSTYTNALSAMSASSVRIPMHFANDAECLNAALRLAGAGPPKRASCACATPWRWIASSHLHTTPLKSPNAMI